MNSSSLVDNRPTRGSVANFLREEIKEGTELSFVSAYFTVNAYAALRSELESAHHLRFLFGEPTFVTDIAKKQTAPPAKIQSTGLSSEALKLNAEARACAEWIESIVEVRSIVRPGFLHGKAYHIKNLNASSAILGSSNFTVPGLGLHPDGGNIELNLVVTDDRDKKELLSWFDEVWNDESLTKDVKQEVLTYLRRIYDHHSPEFIYFLTLFHIFGEELERAEGAEDSLRKTSLLESGIWSKLFSFQKDGVKGMLNKLRDYGGCILADSVGLGKTFEALAVIKAYQSLNKNVLVLCPKKLRQNWEVYRADHRLCPIPEDKLDFRLMSHTDLGRISGESDGRTLADFRWEAYDLIVIDESHNFRNNSIGTPDEDGTIRRPRYQVLMEDVIQAGGKTQVLLLSATPVNNSISDLRNQISLIAGGDVAREESPHYDQVFHESLGVTSLKETCRQAQVKFTKWTKKKPELRKAKDLIHELGSDFFRLLDGLSIARSRSQIKRYYSHELEDLGGFPERNPPQSEYPQIDSKGEFPSFERIDDLIGNLSLSLYHPTHSLKENLPEEVRSQYNHQIGNFTQEGRERILIAMMKTNFLKRLESSISSFRDTIGRTIEKTDGLIQRINDFQTLDNANEKSMKEPDARAGLDLLFAYTEKEHAFTPAEVATLIAAIDEVKVLDPACGSGAFPMGVLHKLVYILGKLDPDNQRWKQTQLAKLDSAPMREQLEAAFADNADDYGRKLYLIENCLYGVDIQPIAIQITKLRFFISLVCDQKTNRNKKDNHGILPLPNLETKFVAADTLISLPEMTELLLVAPRVGVIEKEIESLYHSHFSEQNRTKKLANQRKVKTLRQELAKLLAESLMSPAKSKHVAEWDPFDPQSSADFFDPHWMFGRTLTEGFDIIIGNPPYIQIQKFPKAQKDKWIAQNYQTYKATGDIYCLFYERGSLLLRPGGHLCYITSNKWMRAGYGEAMRNFFATEVDTTAVLDFGMAQNFGAATTYTCIVQAARQPSRHRTYSCYATDDRAAMAEPAEFFATHAVLQKGLCSDPWVVIAKERQRIKTLVEEQGIPLGKWDIQINYGIKTGFNDAFYLTTEQRNAFIAEDPLCEKHLVPLLRGRYVSRYATDWDGTWMIATFPALGYAEAKIPKPIIRHLKSHRAALEPKPRNWTEARWDGRKAGPYQWYEVQDVIGYHKEFLKPKIIYQEIAVTLPFYFDTSETLHIDTTCFMVTSDTEHLPHLMAVLNSSLFRCCFKGNFPEYSGNASRVKKIFMDKIPVKKPTAGQAELFEKLVSLVQLAKRIGEDTPASFLEDLIDACVMECYFREHMAERDLLFHDDLAQILEESHTKARRHEGGKGKEIIFDSENLRVSASPRENSSEVSSETLRAFVASCETHPIRNRLLRLTTASPDLLAVIKQEGKV